MAPRISAVINTYNEERNLPYVLRSVCSWTDEIVVVDMHSEDRTVEIAREFGAKVYFHERTGFVEAARAFAVDQSTGDWIMMLDADEVVPAPLSCRLQEIARNDEADVVIIPWLNYLLGVPLMYTGWGPAQDRHERFFKRGCLQIGKEIHRSLAVSDSIRVLKMHYEPGQAVVHFPYLDSSHFLDKLNRYTSIEARQSNERGTVITPTRSFFACLKVFLTRYVRWRGYRDGWRGFYLSAFMAFYRLATDAKLKELQAVGSPDRVDQVYREAAERVLQEYEAPARDANQRV